jgi:hypothetical protein
MELHNVCQLLRVPSAWHCPLYHSGTRKQQNTQEECHRLEAETVCAHHGCRDKNKLMRSNAKLGLQFLPSKGNQDVLHTIAKESETLRNQKNNTQNGQINYLLTLTVSLSLALLREALVMMVFRLLRMAIRQSSRKSSSSSSRGASPSSSGDCM